MDVTQVVTFALAEAKWVGAVLLAAGVAVRVIGRALGQVLLVMGLLASAALAYHEWQGLHNLLIAGGILLVGGITVGLLAWTIRGLSFLLAFVLIAASFYLLLYGWVDPAFPGTMMGELAWAGATIVTMIVTGLHGGWLNRVPVAALGTGLPH